MSSITINIYRLSSLLRNMDSTDVKVSEVLSIIEYFIKCEKLLMSINYKANLIRSGDKNTRYRTIIRILKSNISKCRSKIMIILKSNSFIKCKGKGNVSLSQEKPQNE